MKKIVILYLIFTSSLFANMGAMLILPQDSDIAMGIYSGISQNSSKVDIESTNSAKNEKSFNFDNTDVLIGGYIGVENSYYRLSLSYDINNDPDVQVQRALLNFDFKIIEKKGLRPMVGFGVGVAMSSYNPYGKNIKDDNGVLAFRAGTEYRVDESNSIEILLEYSHTLTSGIGKSYYEGSDFTTYDLSKQNSVILRIGYNFLF
ncbi:hypothetical protein KKA17_04640 [bacterium]|nr:hypothetical protein [bacterium]MBU1883779.1 hypothetical protein [bacterium]